MNDTKELEHARQNARGHMDSIKELIERLDKAIEADDQNEIDNINDEIMQYPLSVEVQSGWYVPGSDAEDRQPEHYRVLLTTGGPALQITGNMDDNQPSSAILEYQDWFTPWTQYSLEQEETDILLKFAQQFYFGE